MENKDFQYFPTIFHQLVSILLVYFWDCIMLECLILNISV